MPCFHYNIKGIGRVHIRAGKRAKLPPPCVQCHDMSEYLCDFEVAKGVTCDAPLCKDHAHEVGPDRHYCSRHLAEMNAVPLKPQI